MISQVVAGLVMDNDNLNWVWYLGGVRVFILIHGFLMLDRRVLLPLPSDEAVAA